MAVILTATIAVAVSQTVTISVAVGLTTTTVEADRMTAAISTKFLCFGKNIVAVFFVTK